MIGSRCAADAVKSQPLPGHVLQQEYELVKNAFYTEPHDQSSWLYLRWLIGNSLAGWEKAKGSPQEASATQVACCIACLLYCLLAVVWIHVWQVAVGHAWHTHLVYACKP
jgi:uncharacterized membrane protein YbaN (DUF454 family)